ncbi:Rod shape-determining protein MreD [uncultured Gammaproteobacteria bacterium]|uniref:rod shape-determining protein MreD n=1 Tax=Bathymodiolus heckerae thiotrophic gill symbiont TaxID=1052212 RepID=UPI0010B77C19|nr:rod shape-determining protein MreD [Bathymodiolus heckerae thiotrophic gill symbiont]CAC9587644.1 Rod shape-determining protein MreD [uncultured Gammaproteobacteria bacterium]SHN89123.1 Rod shape-determining protein MreD [Bathymodiolus heckerae thiotrophic gill symbiont]
MNTQRPYLFLIKITLFSLILSALPFNEAVLDSSPFWMLLLFSYWLIYFPVRGGLFTALILGTLLDILQGDILGQNALALILASLFINKVKQSFFVSNLSTQQVYIFVAGSIYFCLFFATHILIHGFNDNYYLLLSPLTGAIAWPVVRLLLSKCKHQ